MIRLIIAILIIFVVGSGAQSQSFFEIKASVPEPISNTAVGGLEVDGSWYAYAFSGIDSTKLFSGIHPRSYKYSLETDNWSILPDLPSGQDRIAAGASAVRGKIYILGGYEVFSDGTEVSINNLHVFDPVTDQYESDAAPIPTPIDDQVQCVYKDSLIYSVTGWSNTGNVGDVWIYDVVTKAWKAGTPIPTTPVFEAFGASGTIIGDTLYYIGGARDIGLFSVGNKLRKGYINPADPTDITWTIEEVEGSEIYRSACITQNEKALWLGGSETSYNYDGIAYNGSGGVAATSILLNYDPMTGKLIKGSADFPAIMDLRGLARVGESSYLSIGGMRENQQVTDRVVLYNFDNLVSTEELYDIHVSQAHIFPNPSSDMIRVEKNYNEVDLQLEILSLRGEILYKVESYRGEEISIIHLPAGTYYVRLRSPKTNETLLFIKSE